MSHTYSFPGSPTYSVTFDSLDQMMSALPTNDENLIAAKDVRDAVLTLYWQTQDLGASFSATSSNFLYSNPDPSTTTVGGIVSGTTFSNMTLQQMFDDMFYPYTSPSSIISASNQNREFGSSVATTLSWSAIKGRESITSINVDSLSIAPTGYSQSGTKSATASQNTYTVFTMSVADGISTATSSTSVSWLNAVYWGKTPTLSFPSMTIVGTQPAWADGAGAVFNGNSSGKSLTHSFYGSYNGIDGAGQHLVFAWPTSFGTPIFTINGSINTAFTYSTVSFTNMYGYTASYDIWLSDTAQNSPIASFVIS